jgi:hypothetical protein
LNRVRRFRLRRDRGGRRDLDRLCDFQRHDALAHHIIGAGSGRRDGFALLR